MLFHIDSGALASSFLPFWPQPRVLTMLVVVPVSSTNTSDWKFSAAWLAAHNWRSKATSGRSCSLAYIVFFEAQAEPVNRAPDARIINQNTARRQFDLHIRKRQIAPPS